MYVKRSNKKAGKSIACKRQDGAILPLFAIGMLAILVMAGLALDTSHALLNKSRLQNTVDAAALAGAEVLHQGTGAIGDARQSSFDMFDDNADGDGNGELKASSDVEIYVEFSAGLKPFTPGATQDEAMYVRVRAENFTMPAWLISLLNINEKVVRASAVAGPSPTLGAACDLVPLIVCGVPLAADGGGAANNWGYTPGNITVLKSGSKNGTDSGPIGPGNFQLAKLGAPGSNVLSQNLAGGYQGCAEIGKTVDTQPGNSTGPITTGLNARFQASPKKKYEDFAPDVINKQQDSRLRVDTKDDDIYSNDDIYLGPDPVPVVTGADLDFNYDNYTTRLADKTQYNYDHVSDDGIGEYGRRNLTVIIADCDDHEVNGANTMDILGFGCYFLLQDILEASEKDPDAPPDADTGKGQTNIIYGQFLKACEATGVVGPDPGEEPGPFIIQLYKDSASTDS
jgi:hypothetical protein